MKKTRLMLWTIALVPTALWGNMLVPVTARAQIAPDGTLPTEVMQNGDYFKIDGGGRAGGNLFHSFQEFSVPTGGEAFFNNSMDVENIFSRVTGGNISNIDGLIRANGSANLFLLNPAGIVFGPNARLNIGGAFLGSTASSLLFPNGQEFSTINQPEPLLTINAPIGLWFRGNEGNIVNESTAPGRLNNGMEEVPIGLRVKPGQTLGLVGGNVTLNGGIIRARGVRVELGGLAAAGTVGLNNDGSLSFPELVRRGNVSFADGAIVDVKGEGGGTITVNANDVDILGGTLLQTGIEQGMGSADAGAGDITIDATGAIDIDQSRVLNQVGEDPMEVNQVGAEALGNGGNIEIKGRSLSLRNGAELNNSNFGQGNAGNVTINVDSLELTNGGQINTPAALSNSGTAGSTTVNAATSIRISGNDRTFGASGIFAEVEAGSTGNGNELRIETGRLLVENGGIITTGTLGSGNAGSLNISATESVEVRSNGGLSADVSFKIIDGTLIPVAAGVTGSGGGLTLSTGQLIVKGGGTITSATAGEGDAGDVTISATESVEISGRGSSGSPSGLFTDVAFGFTEGGIVPAIGNGGDVQISTAQLMVKDGARITSNTLGKGNAGNLTIRNAELVEVSGDDAEISANTVGEGNAGNLTISNAEIVKVSGESSGLFTQVQGETTLPELGLTLPPAIGDGGELTISTNRLIVQDGAQVSASTFGKGDAGNLTVNASELIELTGKSAEEGSITGIFSSAIEGTGDGGNITVNAREIRLNRGTFEAETAAGQGNINLTTTSGNIELRNNSRITANATGEATGGNIAIKTNFLIAYPGNNDITARAVQESGGNINITAKDILGIEERDETTSETNDITVSSDFGPSGEIEISILEVDALQGIVERSDDVVVEADEAIAQGCRPDTEGESSSLRIVGRGGVPRGPQDPLTSDTMGVGGKPASQTETPTPIVILVEDTEPISIEDIVPARGWIVNEDGVVELTAYPTPDTTDRPFPKPVRCPRN